MKKSVGSKAAKPSRRPTRPSTHPAARPHPTPSRSVPPVILSPRSFREITPEKSPEKIRLPKELLHARRGCLLHDIGKMAIPDSTLLKPGLLLQEELSVMRQHPTFAFEWLSSIAFLRPTLDIPYCHHERWDGNGYPRRLKGEQIPLPARIFAVVDIWDALRSNRPYREAWPDARVKDYLPSLEGGYFDPRVLRTFMNLYYAQ